MTDRVSTISAKEAVSKFGYYVDQALLHPVSIRGDGTNPVVLISLEEYRRLLRCAR